MFAVFGVILLIAGAILRFAITNNVNNANLHTIGVILIGGGALLAVVAAIQAAGWMSMGNRRFKTERSVSPDGNHVIEETRAG
jgi:uncharacterized membrane protein YidH (DUF202 family)